MRCRRCKRAFSDKLFVRGRSSVKGEVNHRLTVTVRSLGMTDCFWLDRLYTTVPKMRRAIVITISTVNPP